METNTSTINDQGEMVQVQNVQNGRRRGPSAMRLEIEKAIDQFEAAANTNVEPVSVPDLPVPRAHVRGSKEQELARYIASPALIVPIVGGFAEYIWPGISMSDIARTTGLSLGGVSRIFNGKRKARRHTLISIANLYTDGDVAEVEAVIRERVRKRLERERMSQEERNGLIRRFA